MKIRLTVEGTHLTAKALLGKNGVIAVTEIANRIMNPQPTA